MKKAFILGLFFIAFVLMSFVISNDDPPLYKNLKVLPKNITKEQMDSVMHHFAAAVGQKCGFCHEFNAEKKTMDFASDAKQPKETAREMYKMMVKLNKKFFEVKDSKDLGSKLQVTCYTCHHGEEHPDTKAPMRMGPPPGTPPQGPPPGGQMAPPPPPATDSTKHQ